MPKTSRSRNSSPATRATRATRAALLALGSLAAAAVAFAPAACRRVDEPQPAPAKSAAVSSGSASASVKAPTGPAMTAAAATEAPSAFALAPNALCPGPCDAQWDDDGDGKIDRAASYTYLPDGRIDHVRLDLDGDGIVDRDRAYAYRMPAQGDVPPRGIDGAAWQGALFLLGNRIWIPYDRAVIYELPGVSVTDCESATVTPPVPRRIPGEAPVASNPLVKTMKTTCEGRMLTAIETHDASGAKLGSARYSYACWPKERACPATPALAAIPPRTARTLCRADADKVAATFDPDPTKKPAAKGMPLGLGGPSHEAHDARIEPLPDGVRLVDVPPKGPVERLGLRADDRLAAVAGVFLDKRPGGALRKAVAAAADFDVVLVRAGQPVTLHVHVGGDCAK
jgi:hypothetical protein